ASISRDMTSLITTEQFQQVRRFKQILSRYQRNRDLISVGVYVAGADPQLEDAIARYPRLEVYLQQNIGDSVDYGTAIDQLQLSLETREAYA
ncbi:flagellum-specific ATP synthase FliI, partial [Macrococcus lamae]